MNGLSVYQELSQWSNLNSNFITLPCTTAKNSAYLTYLSATPSCSPLQHFSYHQRIGKCFSRETVPNIGITSVHFLSLWVLQILHLPGRSPISESIDWCILTRFSRYFQENCSATSQSAISKRESLFCNLDNEESLDIWGHVHDAMKSVFQKD